MGCFPTAIIPTAMPFHGRAPAEGGPAVGASLARRWRFEHAQAGQRGEAMTRGGAQRGAHRGAQRGAQRQGRESNTTARHGEKMVRKMESMRMHEGKDGGGRRLVYNPLSECRMRRASCFPQEVSVALLALLALLLLPLRAGVSCGGVIRVRVCACASCLHRACIVLAACLPGGGSRRCRRRCRARRPGRA